MCGCAEEKVGHLDWTGIGVSSIEMQRSQQHRGKRENESLVEDSPNYKVVVDSQE